MVGHAMALALFGALLGPFSRRWRHKLNVAWLATHKPFEDREIELGALLDRALDEVIVGPVAAGHANVSEAELLAICSIVAQVQAREVFEIGTYDGRTTLAMSRNVARDGHVFTLNLPPDWEEQHPDAASDDTALSTKVRSGERFIGTPDASKITQLWGDSATFDYSPYVGRMDLVFIDGAHTPDYVEKDTNTAATLLRREGGLILWHDATRYGVVEFLERFVRRTNAPMRIIAGTSIGIVARVGDAFVSPVEWTRRQAAHSGPVPNGRVSGSV